MTDKAESAAKKNVLKLQRAIVDGLEDVKAQDIQVYDTEHITSLFERVIVASGTSNRQTKALAASVRDAVREAGFPKPRIEGEDNGEWIIVDCGAAVAHIMQPSIRQYYHLEELWGDKPVNLKPATAPKAAKSLKASADQATSAEKAPAKRVPAKKAPAKSAAGQGAKKAAATQASATPGAGAAARKAAAKKPAVKKAPMKAPDSAAKKASAKSVPMKSAAAKPAPAKKAPAKKASAKTSRG